MSDWFARKSLLTFYFVFSFTVTTAIAADRPARTVPDGATTRERFLKLLERPRPPLDAHEQSASSDQAGFEQRFEFTSEADLRVPGLMVKPVSLQDRSPVVIVLHGTGGSKEGMRPILRKITSQGMIAIAIDGRFAGERSNSSKGAESYYKAIFDSWQSGRNYPFLYDTVWDTMRLLDYLETRTDVDSKRIGAIGFSKGGIELYLAAAADPRIAAAVPCIGVQSFGWALEHDAWRSRIASIQPAADSAAREAGVQTIDAAFVRRFYERMVPGIHREFDGPVMVPLIAPRPLLIINGDRDDRTPLPGLELCIEAARAAYQQAKANDQFESIIQPNTGHAVSPQTEAYAIEWLKKHLAKSN